MPAVVLVALIAGFAVGRFVFPAASGGGRDARRPDSHSHRASKALDDKGAESSLRALRRRIGELERQLAERSAALSETNAVLAETGNPPPFPGDRPREGFRERMERMKRENPAEYANITNRMAEWRQRQAARHQANLEFFASVDTTHMSTSGKIVHERLQNLIAQRENLERQLQAEDLSDENRHALMDQMRETRRQLWALNAKERNNLVEAAARELGFKGQDVKDISATMQEIYDATDNGFGWHGPDGRGHGRAR